ncbi:hypothetical protein LCGC14_0207870 [marine sediment metagenome]|uniref:Uncharacterized protein n=1 Tax=marine sediment metagenome TaxID=412755 RepID=A0A0F9X0M4_9ZZZZ
MRLDTRHHQAAEIKEINQSEWKEKEKYWVQCERCQDWLRDETYFMAQWEVGPTRYCSWTHPNNQWNLERHHVCNACCHSALDVVDYLVEWTSKNKKAYDKSLAKHLKEQKKKEKEALCIVDGKSYSFTFKEEGDK